MNAIDRDLHLMLQAGQQAPGHGVDLQYYCLDFETFYSKDYTLKKQTMEEYVRSPQFEVLCAGLMYPTGYIDHMRPDAIEANLRAIDWSKVALICHNAHFDGLILSHHFGIKPAAWIDTLAMARGLFGNILAADLGSLAKIFKLEAKKIDYKRFKGRHWNDLAPDEQQHMLTGVAHDVQITAMVCSRLLRWFPPYELPIIDATIRMFTEPQLIGDLELLADIWRSEETRKKDLLGELGITDKDVMSTDKFQALLEEAGIEVEFKQGTNGYIPCFAKSDEFMQALLTDEDERVQMLAEARIGNRSTITQSRASRLGWMASRGPMCIYLNPYAATTKRWGGGDKTNFQNMTRKGRLRETIMAPPGKKLGIIDLSQIECRLLNTIAGQHDVVERFRKGEDPYANVASQFYGRPITKADKSERGMGKQSELMCGYGCGAARFRGVARQGNYGPPVYLELEEADRFVKLYRQTHPAVVRFWKDCDWILQYIASGQTDVLKFGPLHVKDGFIILPNNMPMKYELKWDDARNQMLRRSRYGWQKIYGSKLTAEIIQALARVAYSEAMYRCMQEHDQRPVLSSHDESVYIIEDESELEPLLRIYKKALWWCLECPIDAEGIVSERYAK